MELNLQAPDGVFQVTAHGPGWFEVNGERHATALQVSNDSCQPLESAPSSLAQIDVKLFEEVIAKAPAVVLLGTGATSIAATHEIVRLFADAGIGAEAMESVAAARTFNLLVGEGRKVEAFLLPPG